MPDKPEGIVTGRYYPIIDPKTKKQIVTKKGRKWQIVAELPQHYRNKSRTRRYLTVYGSERHVKKEKQKFIIQLNDEVNRNYIPSEFSIDITKISFGEYLQTWLEANKRRLKKRTWEGYYWIAQSHIIPLMGHIPLKKIVPYHISSYKEKKLAELSPVTVNKHLSVISGALEDAALPEKRLLPYNPAALVKRAAGGGNTSMAATNCLTSEELSDLLNKLLLLYSMRGAEKTTETVRKLKSLGFTDKEIASPKALYKFKVSMLYPIVYLGAKTGMRLSELLALKWDDIDFKKKEIRVTVSSHYGKKEGKKSSQHYNSTKEGKPKSFIDLTEKDIEFLKRHRKEQIQRRLIYGDDYKNNNLVFARNNGTHFRNGTVSKEFSIFAKSNNFSVTFHGLRHTHCTLLLAAGVPAMYVARRVGHQKVSTTHEIYSHADKAGGYNLAEVFEETLNTSKISTEKFKETASITAKLLNCFEDKKF